MKLLVTGGAGYIGSHVSHLAKKEGHDLVILDNLSTGNAWALPKGVTFVEGNVGNKELVTTILAKDKPDAVLHFAASIEVEESVQKPLKYYQNNTANTLTLLEACCEQKVNQFIFSSTAAVYGSPEKLPVSETTKVAPISPYGRSKAMTENILEDLSLSHDNFRYVSLRYFNVAGASAAGQIGQAYPNATHLIKVISEVATGRRQDLKVFGNDYDTIDGTCVRDYIHVDDLAQAHLDALAYLDDGGSSNTFNCGYGHGASVKQVIEAFTNATNTQIPFEVVAKRPGDSAQLYADNSKIKSTLGWKPQHDDLEFICKTAYEWEKKRNS